MSPGARTAGSVAAARARARATRLWAALAVELGVAAALLAAGAVACGVSVCAVAIGAPVGVVLFAVFARRRPAFRLRRRRATLVAAKSGVVLARSASEEVLWRGFALVRLAGLAGVPVAVAVATGGFALAHVRGLGRRGIAIHAATGGVFAALCLAVSLAAAIAAHCAYNLLVVLAREGEP